ncbi:zinc finger, CCHC-type containing protein [Tanacetum coccineum]
MDIDNVVSLVADVTMVQKMVLNDFDMETPLESNKGVNVNFNANVEPTTSVLLLASVSFATLLKGHTSQKSVKLRTLFTPAGNGADVVVSLESIRAVSKQFANTAYDFFLGKHMAYPVVANYVRNTLSKYGLVKSMFNSANKLFFFQFSSMHGLDAMLENGLWFIRNNPLILKNWNPDGRSSYARAMIELQADMELKDTIVVVMPKLLGEGFYMCTIRVEINASSSGKKKKVVVASKEVSNLNAFDVLNSAKKDDDLGTNGGHSKSVGKGPKSDAFLSEHGFFYVASSSTKNVDCGSEVEDVVDDHAIFKASTCLKRGANSGYSTNSCGSAFLMNTTRNDRRGGDSNDHQKGWLKLSIGQYNGSVFPQTRLTKTMKVYTCSFCGRKFHNPQALGGHQNAHRTEREAVRRSHGENDNEAREGDHSHVQPSDGEKLEEMEWCGSSYSYLIPASQQPDSNTLDLNLKL